MSSVEQKIAELLEESRLRMMGNSEGNTLEEEEEETLGEEEDTSDEDEEPVTEYRVRKESMDHDQVFEDLLYQEGLSEEFKTKAKVVFEAAVRRRALDIVEEVKAELANVVVAAKNESTGAINEATGELSEAMNEATGEFSEAMNEATSELSEAMEKATSEFSDSISEARSQISDSIFEARQQIAEELREQSETIAEALEENVDKYLTYVVNEWVEDNRIALESSVKSELVENFIFGLKDLFEQHYIEVPEERVDVLASLEETNNVLKAKLNAQISANARLRSSLEEEKRVNAVNRLSEGLTDLDKERFVELVESINYDSFDSFEEKASIIRESYFNRPSKKNRAASSMITESEVSSAASLVEYDDGSTMQRYTNLLDNI